MKLKCVDSYSFCCDTVFLPSFWSPTRNSTVPETVFKIGMFLYAVSPTTRLRSSGNSSVTSSADDTEKFSPILHLDTFHPVNELILSLPPLIGRSSRSSWALALLGVHPDWPGCAFSSSGQSVIRISYWVQNLAQSAHGICRGTAKNTPGKTISDNTTESKKEKYPSGGWRHILMPCDRRRLSRCSRWVHECHGEHLQ